jgi:cell division protease FtsH
MACALAGKAAEEIVYGEASTGSEADIEAATDMARNMAARWGMSSGIGPVRIIGNDAEVFLGRDLASMAQVLPQTLDTLDTEIRVLVEEAERVALTKLTNARADLVKLADWLEELETLEGAKLAELLAPLRPGATAPAQPRGRRVRES